MAAVDGSSGLQGEKTSKNFIVLNELKSPKTKCFFFFSTFGGVVGGSEARGENFHTYLN